MTLASRTQQRLTKNFAGQPPDSAKNAQQPITSQTPETAFGTLRSQDRSSASSTTRVLVHDHARCSPVRRDSGRYRRRVGKSSRARVRSPHNPDKLRSPVRGNRCWQRAPWNSRLPPQRFRGRLVLQSTPDSETVVERVTSDLEFAAMRHMTTAVSAYRWWMPARAAHRRTSARRRAISTELARRLRPHITKSPWLGDIEIGNDQCVRKTRRYLLPLMAAQGAGRLWAAARRESHLASSTGARVVRARAREATRSNSKGSVAKALLRPRMQG
jgi:hypothetical protein